MTLNITFRVVWGPGSLPHDDCYLVFSHGRRPIQLYCVFPQKNHRTLDLNVKYGIDSGQIALMVPCLRVIIKYWRASLNFKFWHVLSLYYYDFFFESSMCTCNSLLLLPLVYSSNKIKLKKTQFFLKLLWLENSKMAPLLFYFR